MNVRLEPHDDFLHEIGPEPNHSESMYFNVFDPSGDLGGFVRIAIRPNEGAGEVTLCLYLPDGLTAFSYARPTTWSATDLESGGMRFRIIEPMRRHEVQYAGKACVLGDARALRDPRLAFRANPWVEVALHLNFTALCSAHGGEPAESHEHACEEFAHAHFEQLMLGMGRVTIGPRDYAIAGAGLRDHSWGPRSWQAPWYYRWLNAAFGSTGGFGVNRITSRDGRVVEGGFVFDGDRVRECSSVQISVDWKDDMPVGVDAVLEAEGQSWFVRGDIERVVPLRNRRELDGVELITEIAEGHTRWTVIDGPDRLTGRTTYGIAELLDQLVAGVPAGRLAGS